MSRLNDDKIELLMEETGCDRAQAESALELSGYEVEEALKTIARLSRHVVVLKGKFQHAESDQFGLIMVIVNVKSGEILRSRAVVSFNPAVYAVPLEKDWFEFEKHLYGCRLWEGSLQTESLEIEKALAEHFRAQPPAAIHALGREDAGDASPEILLLLRQLFGAGVRLKLQKDILDLGQFQALTANPPRARERARPAKGEDQLVLAVTLEPDANGIAASELRAGDMVSARIVDKRDIAQYLAKLFGAFSERGLVPVLAPVEAVESGPEGLLARVRFSVGVCGDAVVDPDARLKVVRIAVRNQERHSWWRRFFAK